MKRYALLALLCLLSWGCGNEQGQNQESQYGERLDKRDYDKLKPFKRREGFAPVKTVDLKKYCPTPVHQDGAICFAYATAYYGRSILYNIQVNETTDPNKNVFSYGFLALLAKNEGQIDKNCKGGSSVAKASEDMATIGAVKLASLRTSCPDKMPLSDVLKHEAANYRVAAQKLYEQCADTSVKIALIKAALAENSPVLFGLVVPASFKVKNAQPYPTLWQLTSWERTHMPCDKSVHAMCIVGYDDSRFGGTFEIVNSWGPGWKNGGFTYISYRDLAVIARYAVKISSLPAEK